MGTGKNLMTEKNISFKSLIKFKLWHKLNRVHLKTVMVCIDKKCIRNLFIVH